MTEEVTKLTPSQHGNNFAASGTSYPENSDNSGSVDKDYENDGQNRVIIRKPDRSLYYENGLAASFLSNQETDHQQQQVSQKIIPWVLS